ncbi:MAG: transcription elongation factor GreA [Chthonomonas sp.]|nr:transcription elongation factor GreA [Chthonomonas sp.]
MTGQINDWNSMEELELSQISSTAVFITPEGYATLQQELDHLTSVKRGEIAERLRDSKMHGEFSEDNNELDEVKFEQAIVENRIAELKGVFAQAQVIDTDTLSVTHVGVGNYVTVRDPERKIEFKIRMVSSFEADPENDLISDESPMGIALMGRAVGDEVEFSAPAGKMRYQVLEISK